MKARIIFMVCCCLNLFACSTAPDNQEENHGGVVGVALGDSTTSTVGGPAVGALVGNESE
ncbi:MAG: osmotically inducible lipoprotein OsmB [Gammaproteobacteria bacterium]|jgi:hypothetical protein